MVGSVLSNRYELLENIGAGGMAIVYKARCRLLNRYVAVKILRPEFQEDEEFLKRFTIEAQAAASLSHPNVVSVFDVGKHGKLNYIVMECIEGITLKEYMKRKGVLSINEAVDFTGQIASALEHAHSKGIIHRDIKPHNIILTNDGVLKVTDFGLARAVSASTNIAGTSTAIGSVHYASPEQARGGFTDERSDIYSLGVVMYEMFTGTLPFDGETPVAIAMKHLQDAPTPPSQKNPQLPAGIEQIILRAMEKDTKVRYPSVTAFLFDFKSIFSGDTSTVHTDKFSTKKLPELPLEEVNVAESKGKTDKRRKEDKIAIIAAIATAIILISLIGFLMVKFLSPNKKATGTKLLVPNLVNTYFEDAQNRYPDFVIEKKASGYSNRIPEGYIIDQDIQEGKEANKGTTILVTVSLGEQTFELPNYKGKKAEDLVQELKRLGLNTDPEFIFEHSDEIEKDNVIRTFPVENALVSVDSVVKIYVSEGKSVIEVAVPYLTGKSEEEAKELLEQNDLLLGEVSSEKSSSAKGKVIKQSVSAGSMISSKSAIDIVLSAGEEDETKKNGNAILSINDLPEDKDTVEIVIKKEDEIIFQANYKTELSPITINLSGEVGTSKVDIYLDGELYKSDVNVTFR